ncbi:MAG: PstS family phosphate ABC transporter substrate-binding protein [Verrucomicrobiota bacterium]
MDGLSGRVTSTASDTLTNLMVIWAEDFLRRYPEDVRFELVGRSGASTAPWALRTGRAELGPTSRPLNDSEIRQLEEKRGIRPTSIGVALDCLAVYVHSENPIASLSVPQLDGMFSRMRKSGFGDDLVTWGQVGLTGAWSERPIHLYGRNSASGTYEYFRKHALFGGRFKDTVKEHPGSASIVRGVSEDPGGIGYSGFGYRTEGVKLLSLARDAGQRAFRPSAEHGLSGEYPLTRMLYIHVVASSEKPLSPAAFEFLRYVLSRDGQAIVSRGGFIPLASEQVETALKRLQKLVSKDPGGGGG